MFRDSLPPTLIVEIFSIMANNTNANRQICIQS